MKTKNSCDQLYCMVVCLFYNVPFPEGTDVVNMLCRKHITPLNQKITLMNRKITLMNRDN